MTGRYDREIFALALPALGALAADPLVSLVDTAFVGRLGATELGALGVNTAIFSLAFFVFNFLAYGTTPMVGRALGRGAQAEAGRIVVQAVTLALGLGFLALGLLELFALPILSAMGASGELQASALPYLRIRALAAPAVLLISAGNGAFRGFQDTRTPLVITLWLNLVNLVLDPLLIFGLGWGLAGAAWATLIAQWFGALWFMWRLLFRNRASYGVVLKLPAARDLRPFLKIGWELAVRSGALTLTLTLATSVATRLGALEVAAHQVASQLWLFLALTVDALAIAGQALVARFLGEARPAEARAVSNRLLLLGLLFGLGLGGIFWALQLPLARLFSDDAAVIARVLAIFPFVALMQPLNAIVFVWDGIFIGAENFAYLAMAMVVSALCSALVLFLVVPLGLGLVGVWWGLVVLMLARLVTLSWRYYLGKGLGTS